MNIITKCCDASCPVGVTEPYFSWIIEDCEDALQLAYELNIYTYDMICVWTSGKVWSDQSVFVRTHDCKFEENTKYVWQVTVYTEHFEIKSEPSCFITGLYKTVGLGWISPPKEINAPVVYKRFRLETMNKYATVNICGLGFFELYINGKKVSDELMNPVRTDYDTVEYKNLLYPFKGKTDKSLHYLTYEVSSYLRCGENYIAVWLGNGWYRQTGRTIEGIIDYGDELKLFVKLVNGMEVIESDESWLCGHSPIVYDNLFYGEIYDARINPSLPYTDKEPHEKYAVHKAKVPEGALKPQLCPPERIIETYEPVKLKKGVYDAGKCMSGFAAITFFGKKGTRVEVSYAEELNEDGSLNFNSTVGGFETEKNLIQKDIYILSGEGEEEYVPRFVWHSFRYFCVNVPESVEIRGVKVHYVCSDIQQRTAFSCSNTLLNSLHQISVNTLKSNIHGDVIMDCAHRERLAYTGDGQLSSYTMVNIFDAYGYYRKWLEDIWDAQNKETGFVPHTAPFYGGGGGVAWGCAIAIITWNAYLYFGDRVLLEKSEEPVRKWIEYLETKKEDGLVVREEEGSMCLGDWCMPKKYPCGAPHPEFIQSPRELVNSVYYIYCVQIYKEMLKILNKPIDPAVDRACEETIQAINQSFLSKGRYAEGARGSDFFPLFVNIVPREHRKQVLDNAVANILKNDYCFDTGMLCTAFLLQVLDRYERNDVAVKMLLHSRYPGFGHMIAHGATALWETWEGDGAQNHIAFSSVGSWLICGLAGIKPCQEKSGYKEISITPYFAEELQWLAVSMECGYGTIELKWNRMDNGINVEVKIPFNTTAILNLKGKTWEVNAGSYQYFL